MNTPVASDTRFMREVNSAAVLTRLRQVTSTSVSALAQATGLSRQAVTRSVAGLEAAGLVDFLAPERSGNRSGRPPQMVRFRAEAGYVLGISVTPDEVRVGVADLVGTVLADAIEALTGPPVADVMTATVTQALEAAGVAPHEVWHVSVGAPGIVDQVARNVQFTPSMPHIMGDVLLRALQEQLPCPAYLDNDVKLATEGERWRAREHHDHPMVLVRWGERVGAGIVVFDRLYRGASNDAGDLGFLDLFSENPASGATTPAPEADKLGRFEEWVGTPELVRLVLEAGRRSGDHALVAALEDSTDQQVPLVAEALAVGNPAAREGTEEITRRFAQGLGAVRALLDPEVVVIGGPMAHCGEALLTALARHLQGQRLNPPRLELSCLGDDAVVQGAIHHSLAEVERDTLRLPPRAGLYA